MVDSSGTATWKLPSASVKTIVLGLSPDGGRRGGFPRFRRLLFLSGVGWGEGREGSVMSSPELVLFL